VTPSKPERRRVAAELVRQHHEHKTEAECDRRHREEIHGDELLGVMIKKCSLRLRRRPALALRAILSDRRCGDMEPEFCQFRLNPGTAPSGIGLPHSPNQIDQFPVFRRATCPWPGFPASEKQETGLLPADGGWTITNSVVHRY
jgi:hypothetical protein